MEGKKKRKDDSLRQLSYCLSTSRISFFFFFALFSRILWLHPKETTVFGSCFLSTNP